MSRSCTYVIYVKEKIRNYFAMRALRITSIKVKHFRYTIENVTTSPIERIAALNVYDRDNNSFQVQKTLVFFFLRTVHVNVHCTVSTRDKS